MSNESDIMAPKPKKTKEQIEEERRLAEEERRIAEEGKPGGCGVD